MEMYEANSCVRGFHIHNDIWTPFVGELLTCKQEIGNPNDLYAVIRKGSLPFCVVSRESTVTHLTDSLFDCTSFNFCKYLVFSLLAVDSFKLMVRFEAKCFAAIVAPFSATYFPIFALGADV